MALLAMLAFMGCGDDASGPAPAAGTLFGSVLDPLRDRPVAGATVSVEPVSSESGQRARSSETDDEGAYEFSDLAPGKYLLLVDPSGIVVNPLEAHLAHVAHASTISIAPGAELRVDVDSPVVDMREAVEVVSGRETVLEPASIPGLRLVIPKDAVRFPAGLSTRTLHVVELDFQAGPEPTPAMVVPQVMIRIFPDGVHFDAPASIRYPDRDPSPEGQHYIYFHHDAEFGDWVHDGGATSDGTSIAPDAGTSTAGSGAHFVSCAPQRVTGIVRDSEATPVEGAVVTLDAWVRVGARASQAYPLDPAVTTTTDATGRFEFGAVSASELSARISFVSPTAVGRLQGLEPRAADGSGTIDFGSLALELETETYFSVEGIVRRLYGFPAHNVSVGWQFEPILKRRDGQTTTGSDGRYAMEVVAAPGSQVWIWGYDESDFLGGARSITAPQLSASGSRVEVDLDLCLEGWGDSPTPCGYAGSWTFDGEWLERTLRYDSCDGEKTLELPEWELLGLIEGQLIVRVAGDDGPPTTYTRVSNRGPSGVTLENLPGLYSSADHREIVALYPDGRLHQLRNFFPGRGFTQYGRYARDGESLALDFVYNDGLDGPRAGDSQQLSFARQGDRLVLTAIEGSRDYVACDNAAMFDEMQTLWLDVEEAAFGLLFYAGEFAGVGD